MKRIFCNLESRIGYTATIAFVSRNILYLLVFLCNIVRFLQAETIVNWTIYLIFGRTLLQLGADYIILFADRLHLEDDEFIARQLIDVPDYVVFLLTIIIMHYI